MEESLSDSLITILSALQTATQRNDTNCLKLINKEANLLIERVKEIEEKLKEIEKQ